MDGKDLHSWLDEYFRAWLSNDRARVARLFASDAVYATSPFSEPWRGREEIVNRWTSGSSDLRRSSYQVLLFDEDSAAVHWNVVMGMEDLELLELDGILWLKFDSNDQCTEHREWYAEKASRLPGETAVDDV